MTHPQSKCKHCPHLVSEHTARAGCMNRRERGIICGCGWTSGAGQGASPFGSVGGFASTLAAGPFSTPVEDSTPTERMVTMTTSLWNIAGVAAELSVTPQAASAWHRGPEKTPAPSFKVEQTGLELWTVDDIELWHQWVENRAAAAKAEKEALAAASKAKQAAKANVDDGPMKVTANGLEEFVAVEVQDPAAEAEQTAAAAKATKKAIA